MTNNLNRITLSICIPTFNRCTPLKNLLNSIKKDIAQSNIPHDKIQIVITDNNSNDGTDKMVASLEKEFINIIYHKNNENLGFGPNLNKSIELATGEYCWLIGSDDSIVANALQFVYTEILESGPTLLTCSAITEGRARHFWGKENFNQKFDDPTSIAKTLCKSKEISALFAFMSVIIVDRKTWNETKINEKEIHHPYTHTIRIFRILEHKSTTFSFRNKIIVKTGSESNEFNTRLHKHLLLDLNTFSHLLERSIAIDTSIREHFKHLVLMQYSKRRLILCRATASTQEWEEITEKFRYFNINTTGKKNILDKPYLAIYNALKSTKRKIRKICEFH